MVDPAILSSITLTGPELVETSTTLIDCSPVICRVLEDRMATCPPGAGSTERVGVGVGAGPGEGGTLGSTDGEGDTPGAGAAAAASADHAVTAASASPNAAASAARRPLALGLR